LGSDWKQSCGFRQYLSFAYENTGHPQISDFKEVRLLPKHLVEQVLNVVQAEILQNTFIVFQIAENWKEETETQH